MGFKEKEKGVFGLGGGVFMGVWGGPKCPRGGCESILSENFDAKKTKSFLVKINEGVFVVVIPTRLKKNKPF